MNNELHLQQRRTFAVISHPDAGKTTLTEKLLLFGGGIRTAGAVKSNKIKKTATSDFMEIEKQRGISVATAVMTFEYDNKLINILDTPGHKDFAEDTYRTLSAVDSVILVIDCVKGVEEQTEKLMQVCRMRRTPVIVFVNKLDRDGRPSFELMDEIENKLGITVRPLTWPVGMGRSFKGVYNLHGANLYLFQPGKTVIEEHRMLVNSLDDPQLETQLGKNAAEQLREDVSLIEGVYSRFDHEDYLSGEVAPVFFGSALNNFGVRELLETFLELAPPPRPRDTDLRTVMPDEESFSGFVFKIHANLDPRHRDRIAFLRVCSGVFERGRPYHHVRQNKDIRFSTTYSFMAERKNAVDKAYPGDVVGIYDRGDMVIGDTVTEGERHTFQGIPNFSPTIFKEVMNADPLRTKQLEKGLQQLTEEGVAQLFIQQPGRRQIIGAVGELQFEVIQYRLREEYGAACSMKSLPYARACWFTFEDKSAGETFRRFREHQIAEDKKGRPVYFAESEWMLSSIMRDNPKVRFHFTSELEGEGVSRESLAGIGGRPRP